MVGQVREDILTNIPKQVTTHTDFSDQLLDAQRRASNPTNRVDVTYMTDDELMEFLSR